MAGTNSMPNFSENVLEMGLEGFGGACQVAVWPQEFGKAAM